MTLRDTWNYKTVSRAGQLLSDSLNCSTNCSTLMRSVQTKIIKMGGRMVRHLEAELRKVQAETATGSEVGPTIRNQEPTGLIEEQDHKCPGQTLEP